MKRSATYAVVGDVHGHLQLALCTLARWQRDLAKPFSAVFLCGDVGTFTNQTGFDSATLSHARDNPCELEFQTQWSRMPPAPWLDAIFLPEPQGLGLCCPVVMVHGNHEGFAHLDAITPRRRPTKPVPFNALPQVDPNGHIQLLPSGWSAETPEGYIVGGIGGMQAGQRRARYHSMAYIEDDAVQHLLLHAPPLDLLLTHQGPAAVQGEGHGSPILDLLLESSPSKARLWFHGHSTPIQNAVNIGTTQVVPLGDIAFKQGEPGLDGWAILEMEGPQCRLTVEPPPFWRELRQKFWHQTPDGLLVHPDLVPFMD